MTRSLSVSRRARARRAHRSRVIGCIGLALLACAPLSSCASSHEYWSLPCSRASYSHGAFNGPTAGGGHPIALVLVFLPIVIDIVVLPVTLPRDAYVAVAG